jgi:molybdopterin converting factor small subunit
MARLRLFGPAREAAGTGSVEMTGESVERILSAAEGRFGQDFARVVAVSSIWLNGVAAAPDARVDSDDEVAVIPPVSGG